MVDAAVSPSSPAPRFRHTPRCGYDQPMYTDALSFLEDERDSWRPYETLGQLTDDELERPVEGAHGWSGRDLMGHLVTWQLLSLDVAKELAVGERSPSHEVADA